MTRLTIAALLLPAACKATGAFDVGDRTGGGGGASACEVGLTVSWAVDDTVVGVDLADGALPFDERRLQMRAVQIEAAAGATLSLTGPLMWLRAGWSLRQIVQSVTGPTVRACWLRLIDQKGICFPRCGGRTVSTTARA